MYNIFEAPTIQIDLSANDSAIYLNNIQNIIETPFASKVCFYGECIDTEFVNKISRKYPSIEYYVPTNDDYEGTDNISFYNLIDLCDITKIERIPPGLVFLRIDLSSSIDLSDINHLNHLMEENPIILIFKLVSTKIIKNLDFCNFISKLELINFDFYFDGLVKPLNIIRKHPCNAYLCNGQKCHSSKSNYPRYLHVTKKGIYPYSAKINEISMLKEIATQSINFQEYLEQGYKNSPEHTLFLDINRYLFHEYAVNQMFEYLPWNIFMEKIHYEKY